MAESRRNNNNDGTTIGRFLASRLAEIGIEHYFVMPGDYNMCLLDEVLKNQRLKMIGCCNELNAGFAADGYARARGAAAVFVTYTVGSLSLVNAVAGAYSADLPLIVISGGPNSNDNGTNRVLHHTIGLPTRNQALNIFREITAEAVIVSHAVDAASMIDRAISRALLLSKPVYIEICCNLAQLPTTRPVPYHIVPIIPSNPASLKAAVSAAADLLNKAMKPVLVAGYKLRMAKAGEAFVALANAIGCAVATMPDAKGFFPEHHPGFIGTYWGGIGSPCVCETVESSDAYLFAGPVFNDYSTVGYSTLIHREHMIEVLPDRVRMAKAEFGCVYMAEFLQALASAVNKNETSLKMFGRMRLEEGELTGAPAYRGPSDERLQSWMLTPRIQDILFESNYAVITETGDSWFHGQRLKLPRATKYESQMQYGSIGWSVPAALGFALGQKNRVIGLIGDGSFQVTAQEVSTFIRYNVNAIIFLINNYGYSIESMIHDGPYNQIKNWDYAGLVRCLNDNDGKGLAFKVKTENELVAAIAEAVRYEGFVLIECILEPDDCTKELLEFGTRVHAASSRPPKFAEDF